jgi:hypothetical protein
LVWEQPHPILLAELCVRAAQAWDEQKVLLESYRDVVIESAEFMYDFIRKEGENFVLGPPLIPAQERHRPEEVWNPCYEEEYFRWGLSAANRWLERLGEAPRADFAEAAVKLKPPVVQDGVYLAHENCPDTFTKAPYNTDHPSMLGAYGLIPSPVIQREAMNATLERVLQAWDIPSTWGWDFPLMAMTACRLGRFTDAVHILLMDSPKNTYLPNGHNAQGKRDDLPCYLPGNGGLLLALAMLATNEEAARILGWQSEGITPYI